MFAFFAVSFAFAIADFMHFSMPSASRLLVNRRIARAALTSLPRIRSTTSRAFCADPRRYLALAIASIVTSSFACWRFERNRHYPATLTPTRNLLLRLCYLRRLFYFRSRVALKGSRRRKFTELVAHHVFRNVDRHVALAIVNAKCQPDHIRSDR